MQQLISGLTNFINGPALFFGSQPMFYDIPEYLQIVSANSFLQSISLGHFPIHPVFMGILWLLIKFLMVNTIAMFFGVISILVFHKVSKLIFKKGNYWLSTIIFMLLPAVWLINTNLMVESMTLTFFLAALYFFLSKKKIWFFVSLFLMIGTHIQSIFWIPSIFLVPYIVEIKFEKKKLYEYIKVFLWATVSSIIFYVLIYYISGQGIGGTTEQLSTYFSSGILRMIRNLWLSFVRDFGTLTPFVLAFLLFKKEKSKQVFMAWLAFLLLVSLIGANWQGDFMGRRIIFAGVILALGLYKYLHKWSVLFILYLVPIILANIILYSNPSPFVVPNIPKEQVLIETHYLKPFTKYDGTILWIGENDLGGIDNHLKNGTRVFMTKQAVTAPYLLLVGQNYHITSLGKVGDSESKYLFEKYSFEQYNNVLELKKLKGTEISNSAGEPVIYYNQNFLGRLARRRIDYGDIGTWIWAIAVNHRDPTGWVYKDIRGMVSY